MGHKEHLLRSSPEIINKSAPGLVFDYVATRDIRPSEEMFLDYGDAWEAAWRGHVDNWISPDPEGEYQSARSWNELNAEEVLLTAEEQEEMPYPSNFEMRCLDGVGTREEAFAKLMYGVVPGVSCTILDREEGADGEHTYQVRFTEHNAEKDDQEDRTAWSIREAIWFVDVSYTTDLFVQGAFRHPLGFPDDIFPEAWRGVYLTFT